MTAGGSTTRVVYADGPGAARIAPRAAIEAAGLDGPAEVLLGWTIEPPEWLDDPVREPGLRCATVLAGYGLARAVDDGRVTPLPVRLSAVAPMLVGDPPDLAVIGVVRRGRGYAFAGSVGWADVLAGVARRVVLEVDDHGADLGGPDVDGNVVATVARPARSGSPPATARPADQIDLRIGALVAALVPDAATLQFGPGGIGEGIARSLDRPVRIWSGLCTDAVASLADRGLLDSPAVAAYTWGGAPVERLAASGGLALRSATVTHDLTRISAIPRFIGCNTALQVGLDGAVNVERIGSRVIAAVGGHSDFCAGASRSPGGISVVALRSCAADGSSTIVDRVDVVSTQRSDIDVVVTEHGVADLRGAGDRERAVRLAALAAPHHRERLGVASR
ncbi:MAG TPA: acetyl-CoA hydrolase/transferase C-terminal domain-containing protein [Ilumatobacter sp.]